MKTRLILLILVSLLFTSCHLICQSDEVITINEKQSVPTKEGDIKYFIYTNNEVFTVQDNIETLMWNCSDVYNSLKEGETYKVKATGVRIPFFSMYRNINKVY